MSSNGVSTHHTPPPGRSTWVFDEAVASVFTDMLTRSVPCYWQAQNIIAKLAAETLDYGGVIIDLGVSTASTFTLIDEALKGTDKVRYYGVDTSAAMLEKAKQAFPKAQYYQMPSDDFLFMSATMFNVAILSLTMQFIPIEHRQSILRGLRVKLLPKGRIFVFEKCLGRDAVEESFYTKEYYDFKMAQGYSLESVMDKRRSLENVLVPLPVETHETMFRREGFRTTMLLKWFNFTLWMLEGE